MLLLNLSARNPPANVPTPPTALNSEIQYPACEAIIPCERWKNALLNAPEAYQTTEWRAAARLR